MSRIKPIRIMNEPGLSSLEKEAVLDGVEEMLKITGVENIIQIIDLGAWKNEKGYLDKNGFLIPHQSIDWYIKTGKALSNNKTQINASDLLMLLNSYEPFEKYGILVLQSGIYLGTNPIVGQAAFGGPGIVISTNKLKDLDEKTKYGCIKTATMHEIGHNFGLVPYRGPDVDYTHCANKCVMRPGKPSPEALITMTEDRLEYCPFCEPCETHLKKWFKEKPNTGGKPIILYRKRRD